MATFTASNPFTLSKALLKSWLDKVFDNTTLIKGGQTAIQFGDVSLSPLSPAALAAGDTHNWNPTGLYPADGSLGICWIRVTTDAGNSAITGIVAPSPAMPKILILTNLGPGFFTMKNDTGSTAANRFYSGSSGDQTMYGSDSMICVYDVTATRWRCIAKLR